jgi:hypothetical protein
VAGEGGGEMTVAAEVGVGHRVGGGLSWGRSVGANVPWRSWPDKAPPISTPTQQTADRATTPATIHTQFLVLITLVLVQSSGSINPLGVFPTPQQAWSSVSVGHTPRTGCSSLSREAHPREEEVFLWTTLHRPCFEESHDPILAGKMTCANDQMPSSPLSWMNDTMLSRRSMPSSSPSSMTGSWFTPSSVR